MTRRTRKVPPVRPPQESPKSSPESSGSQKWLGWAAVILVGVIVIIGVALTVERFNDDPERIGAEVQVTPIVGGMVVPTAAAVAGSGEPQVTATSGGVVSATAPAPAAQETITRTAGVAVTAGSTESAGTPSSDATAQDSQEAGTTLVFEPGMTVQRSAGEVLVYAEPGVDAPVMDTYVPGAALTVLEPGGDFTGYPVVVDAVGWVRVRAADGLVGWTPAVGLSLVD